MANRIKGITVEIGGDTTKLDKALKNVNSTISNTQSQLKDVERLLKLDPGNTELLVQKHRLLGEAVSTTKEKLETLKTAAEQANAALASGDISQEQYDALQREIIATTEELRRLEDRANQSSVAVQKIAAVGEGLKTTGDKISGVGEKLLPVTGTIIGLGTAAVKIAADFDSQMSKVAAISGATGDEMEALRDKAQEMGAKTKFSASEAGAAFEYMAMAGWETRDMLDGIEGIMNLAAASGESLATTSDIVTDALTAFGLGAEDSAHFADILAAASSNANTNVSMMGETFKYAAPLAGKMGYSAEDTALAIGLMANSGIKASQAGTSLRGVLTNLSKPSDTVLMAMNRLGISLDDGNGHMYSLREVMGQLRESFAGVKFDTEEYISRVAGLTQLLEEGTITEEDYNEQVEETANMFLKAADAQKAELAASLAGKNALSGLLAIISASDKDWNKLSEAIDNCTYNLNEISEVLESSGIEWSKYADKAWQATGNGIQRLTDEIIYNLSEVGTNAEDLQEYLMMEYELDANDAIAAIQSVTEAMENSTGVTERMASIMQDNLEGQITILNSSLAKLANSFGEMIMPMAQQVVEWIQKFVDKLNSMDDETRKMIITIAAVAAALAPLLIIIGNVISAVGTIMTLGPKIVGAINTVKTTFAALSATLLANPFALFIAALVALVAALVYFWNTNEEFRNFCIELWENLKNGFQALCDTVAELVAGVVNWIIEHWQKLQETVSAILEAIQLIFTAAWTAIKNTIVKKLGEIKTKVSTVWDAIRSAVEAVLDAISSFVSSAWDTIRTTVSGAMDAVKNTVTTAWNTVKSTVSGAIEAVKTTVSNGLNSAKNTVTNTLNAIRDTFSNIWDRAKQIVSNAIDTIKNLMNFQWELPKLKLPHFSITGSFSLDPPSMPSISVEWYRKAMGEGMILTSPTIFGAQGNHLLGGGEAGPEAVVGAESLRQMIMDAVSGASFGGDITIPVYIGNHRLDTLLVSAAQRSNYRSGGR